jgi:hypothetical protein
LSKPASTELPVSIPVRDLAGAQLAVDLSCANTLSPTPHVQLWQQLLYTHITQSIGRVAL